MPQHHPFFGMFGGALQHILLRCRMTRRQYLHGGARPLVALSQLPLNSALVLTEGAHGKGVMEHVLARSIERVTSHEVGKLIVARRQKVAAHGRAQVRSVGRVGSRNSTR
jgi:hypothetical protein